ncbi:hypothetical protein TWF718_005375 [Orbilia javanica]|uniref:Uncharacterized protein n=1 Tax=Orbilia javanica TaxID=47235 RepID=A0AAN8N7J7_9PEZI
MVEGSERCMAIAQFRIKSNARTFKATPVRPEMSLFWKQFQTFCATARRALAATSQCIALYADGSNSKGNKVLSVFVVL